MQQQKLHARGKFANGWVVQGFQQRAFHQRARIGYSLTDQL
jgi:hypothetical protein